MTEPHSRRRTACACLAAPPDVGDVRLIPDQGDMRHGLVSEGVPHEAVPVLKVLK
eukprot:CAMPEP_0185561884 /NCGR_PEP_ID=MMETSP1381-20130426/60145_1 /TAXON_ID=298111 /ORGANISM="Pavlova sp., Strain CCMP459" /LENGTH=54 /DNA_ID=CAMNT_0028175685 /DNA_START=42 /DNA_END=207 /DNA_ORIENTATION=+